MHLSVTAYVAGKLLVVGPFLSRKESNWQPFTITNASSQILLNQVVPFPFSPNGSTTLYSFLYRTKRSRDRFQSVNCSQCWRLISGKQCGNKKAHGTCLCQLDWSLCSNFKPRNTLVSLTDLQVHIIVLCPVWWVCLLLAKRLKQNSTANNQSMMLLPGLMKEVTATTRHSVSQIEDL